MWGIICRRCSLCWAVRLCEGVVIGFIVEVDFGVDLTLFLLPSPTLSYIPTQL
jgi:hypothetical protein